jgi:hypothetical protein
VAVRRVARVRRIGVGVDLKLDTRGAVRRCMDVTHRQQIASEQADDEQQSDPGAHDDQYPGLTHH